MTKIYEWLNRKYSFSLDSTVQWMLGTGLSFFFFYAIWRYLFLKRFIFLCDKKTGTILTGGHGIRKKSLRLAWSFFWQWTVLMTLLLLPVYLLQGFFSLPWFEQYGGLIMDVLNFFISYAIISTMLKREEFLLINKQLVKERGCGF